MIPLTLVERCAVTGMEAIGREIHARYADELHWHGVKTLDLLAEIAVAHDLPADAFFDGWGVDTQAGLIVRLDGVTPPEVEA